MELVLPLVKGFTVTIGQLLRLELQQDSVEQRELIRAHLFDLAMKNRLELLGLDIRRLRVRSHACNVVGPAWPSKMNLAEIVNDVEIVLRSMPSCRAP